MGDQDLETIVQTCSENNSSFSKFLKGSHDSIVSNNNNYEPTMNTLDMEVEVEALKDEDQPHSSHINTSFQSFVFFDTEATGIRSSTSKARITELCFVALSKNDLIQFKKELTGSVEPYKVTPRVTSKINLCFNPVSLIMPQISDLTGLDNYNLEFQNRFSADTIVLLSAFLSHLPQPICLVAHNGLEFDFPLLKSEILKTNRNLYADFLVVDSLHALKDIFDKESSSNSNDQTSGGSDNEVNFGFHKIDWNSDDEKNEVAGHRDPLDGKDLSTPIKLESSLNRYDLPITPPTTTHKRPRLNTGNLNSDFSSNNGVDLPEQDRFKWARVAEVLRDENEVTPDRLSNPQVTTHLQAPVKARYFNPPTERMLGAVRARKRLDFSASQPPSFSLTKLHEHIFGRAPEAAHGAEVDCLSLLRICASKAQPFIDYSEKNGKLFSSVKQMW